MHLNGPEVHLDRSHRALCGWTPCVHACCLALLWCCATRAAHVHPTSPYLHTVGHHWVHADGLCFSIVRACRVLVLDALCQSMCRCTPRLGRLRGLRRNRYRNAFSRYSAACCCRKCPTFDQARLQAPQSHTRVHHCTPVLWGHPIHDEGVRGGGPSAFLRSPPGEHCVPPVRVCVCDG